MTPSASAATPRVRAFGPSHPRFPPRWAQRFGEDRYGIFAEFDLNGITFAWRWIPPGRFLMGSPDDELGRRPDEGPQHEVTLTHGFWMGTTPVTVQQWAPLDPTRKSYSLRDLAVPKTNVSWNDCRLYARSLGMFMNGLAANLPTEAQWEYACRAGTTGAFHDGSPCTVPERLDPALDKLGWFDGNSDFDLHAVGLKRCNAWGLHDMHGGVSEWCRDPYRVYGDAHEINPGDDQPYMGQSQYTIRGGSCWGIASGCRSASRFKTPADYRGHDVGFRLMAT